MMRFLRSLPPTPDVYRNEKALADLMLGEDAFGYLAGRDPRPAVARATAIRMMVAATRQGPWPDIDGHRGGDRLQQRLRRHLSVQPVPRPGTNSLFENAPAVAAGIRRQWDQTGHPDRRLWVMGGDGAMYDIGFQALSRMVASGADIKVLVLDTQVYSNTGGQASTASFGGQVTKLSAFGAAQHGRPEARKELGRILMAHGDVYVAQTTPAHVNHFYRAILEANEFPGPAVIISYAACMPEHGIADDAASRQARLAVDSRAFPLFTYDPRRGSRISDRLSLQGNPAIREDWSTTPAGDPVDFLTFARSEGRFAPHFGPSGVPTAEIQGDQRRPPRQLAHAPGNGGHPTVRLSRAHATMRGLPRCCRIDQRRTVDNTGSGVIHASWEADEGQAGPARTGSPVRRHLGRWHRGARGDRGRGRGARRDGPHPRGRPRGVLLHRRRGHRPDRAWRDFVNTLGPGEFFGEIALLDGGPRTATAVAETPCRLLSMTYQMFHELLDSSPEIRTAILEGSAAGFGSSTGSPRPDLLVRLGRRRTGRWARTGPYRRGRPADAR